MNAARYDTFVKSLSDLPEDRELTIAIRDLSPGIYKYTYKHVRARVSPDPSHYPNTLAIRFGRGQLHHKLYSIQILEELPTIPKQA